MLIGIIAIIIFLSVFVLIHELGHFLAAKKFGLLVEEFGFGLPPRIWGKKIGETIYSINALLFGGFVKIYGENREEEPTQNTRRVDSGHSDKFVISGRNRSFSNLSISKRALIIASGVLMNFLLGWLIISIIFSIGIPQAILITKVELNSPAAEIGLQAGDKILSVEADLRGLDTRINADNFVKFVNEHQGREIILKIEREGQIKEFKTIPRVNPPAGEGALGIGLIEAGLAKKNLISSIWEGLKTSVEIIQAVFVAIFNLISKVFIGQASLKQIAGPVGIVKMTAQAGNLGFVYLLQLLALISLNLVVINILPFPALDGGRLLFLLIEKIKGSPLPARFERYANTVGMALLLFLMAIITIKEIGII